MILLKDHEGLDDVLRHIKIQIIDSIQYACDVVPDFSDPELLFYWLKERITYKSDPTTIELIMTMQTMMDGFRTGVPGAGDCDDFTITALASLYACGFMDNEIVLSGNDKYNPVHIYCRTNVDGYWFVFDLTENYFNEERNYKYYQYLPFKFKY